MNRIPLNNVAEVRPAEDMWARADKVRQREKKSRKDRLVCAKEQAVDAYASRREAKRGQWGKWCERAGLSQKQAWRYVEFGKSVVTTDFPALSEDEQWSVWERISDNAPPDEEEDKPETQPTRSRNAPEPREEETPLGIFEACEEESPLSSLDLPLVSPDYFTVEHWHEMSAGDRLKTIREANGDTKFNAQKNDSIEWALWSWNPVTGCLHNCPYCYARDIATSGPTARAFPNGFAPTFIPSRLKAPHNTTFPEAEAARCLGHKNVFVCSMADLFGRWVPREWIDAVLAEVRAAPQWNFLFLTKFPVRMAEFDFPKNAWVGTTVDCQARVANAERSFRKVRAGVKWLSLEPLIEPLAFTDLSAFDWVVIGGSSRSSQTPEWHPPRRWVLELTEQAERAGAIVYEKTNLLQRRTDYPGIAGVIRPQQAPESLRYLPTPETISS